MCGAFKFFLFLVLEQVSGFTRIRNLYFFKAPNRFYNIYDEDVFFVLTKNLPG